MPTHRTLRAEIDQGGQLGRPRRRRLRSWLRWVLVALGISLLALATVLQPKGMAAPTAFGPPIPEIRAGTTVPITTAWGVVSAIFAPIWIAYDGGYFRQYGLEVTLERIQGTVQAQAVVAGKIEIGNLGGAELLNVRAAGSPMVALLQTTDSPVFELHALPSIRSVADLKGKTIAITRAGSTTDMAARVVLKNHGLVAGQDVKLLNMNEMSGIIAAMQRGVVQGGMLSYPAAVNATAAGFPMIASTVDEHVHLQQSLTVAMKPYADAHPAVVLAYLKAYLLGLRDFLQKPEVAHAAIASYAKTDLATARAAYGANLAAMKSSHFVNEEGFKTVQQYGGNPKTADVKLADAHDDRFLRALEATGFFRRIGLKP